MYHPLKWAPIRQPGKRNYAKTADVCDIDDMPITTVNSVAHVEIPIQLLVGL